MNAGEIAGQLGGRKSARGWIARCPAHEDSSPSLSLTERNGRLLVRCFAGCPQNAVIEALRDRGLWPATEQRPQTPAERRAAAEQRRRDARDLEAARHFRAAADLLIDELLETLPVSDLSRGPLTAVKAATRSDAGLLAEYRDWQEREPELTAALVAAGRNRGARLEMMLRHYLLGGAKNAA